MAQALAQFEYTTFEDDGDPDRPFARPHHDDVAFIRPTCPMAVSIFADRAYLRSEMAEDAAAAGLRVARTAELGALAAASDQAIGDVVLVDCPVVDGTEMAALARLDQRVAQSGRR